MDDGKGRHSSSELGKCREVRSTCQSGGDLKRQELYLLPIFTPWNTYQSFAEPYWLLPQWCQTIKIAKKIHLSTSNHKKSDHGKSPFWGHDRCNVYMQSSDRDHTLFCACNKITFFFQLNTKTKRNQSTPPIQAIPQIKLKINLYRFVTKFDSAVQNVAFWVSTLPNYLTDKNSFFTR